MSATRRDDGFTLVEMIVVMGIVGFVAITIAASITVFLRTNETATDRITDTRDLQNLANFLPGDVASASEIRAVAIDDSTACGSGGVPVLQLNWSQRWLDGSTEVFEVTYRVDGDELVRHACDGAGDRSFVVARNSAVSVSTPEEGSVKFELSFPDGEFRRITATSRNFVVAP